MTLMVEINVWRGDSGRRWRPSRRFPFVRRVARGTLVHRHWDRLDLGQKVYFGEGGLVEVGGDIRVLGYDFEPSIAPMSMFVIDLDGNAQPL